LMTQYALRLNLHQLFGISPLRAALAYRDGRWLQADRLAKRRPCISADAVESLFVLASSLVSGEKTDFPSAENKGSEENHINPSIGGR